MSMRRSGMSISAAFIFASIANAQCDPVFVNAESELLWSTDCSCSLDNGGLDTKIFGMTVSTIEGFAGPCGWGSTRSGCGTNPNVFKLGAGVPYWLYSYSCPEEYTYDVITCQGPTIPPPHECFTFNDDPYCFTYGRMYALSGGLAMTGFWHYHFAYGCNSLCHWSVTSKFVKLACTSGTPQPRIIGTLNVGAPALGPSGPAHINTLMRTASISYVGSGYSVLASHVLCRYGQQFSGYQTNPNPGQYGFEYDVDVNPNGEAGSAELVVNDEQMDLNSDNRFNQLDVGVLASEIGNAATGDFAKFDMNQNGVLDSTDVGVFQAVVDAGLDSGIFGDSNNDGVLNCADRGAAPSTWNLKFGDTGYRVSLDFDIDGDNDSADESAFDSMVIAADVDFNNDTSSFDPQDIDAFLSVYGEGPCIPSTATCDSIDFNGDGSLFDPGDIDAFMAAYSTGEC